MRYEILDDLVLLVHNQASPSTYEWDAYVASVREAVAARNLLGLLVISNGAGPNAKQRKDIVEAYGEGAVAVGVCSSSAIARAITTAISWFYPKPMRSFNYNEIDEALKFLMVEPYRWPDIHVVIESHQDAIRRLGS